VKNVFNYWPVEVAGVNDVSIVTFFRCRWGRVKSEEGEQLFSPCEKTTKEERTKSRIPVIGSGAPGHTLRKQDFRASQSNRRKCGGKQKMEELDDWLIV
jgi:hypothetical protein